MQWIIPHRNPRPAVAMALLTALCLGHPAAALARGAEWPDTPVLAASEPVPDHELAEMRGRFVRGGNVLHFGVEMVSRFHAAGGHRLQSSVDMRVDLSGSDPRVRFVPVVSIRNPDGSAGSTTRAGGAAGATGTGGGMAGQGVHQRVQVAGDANNAFNDLRIDIVDSMPGVAPEAVTTTTHAAASGTAAARVRVATGRGGVGMALDLPGSGHVSQRIVAGRGLEQSIRLQGDLHAATSVTTLRLQLRNPLTGRVGSMRQTLDTLRALR